MSKKLQFIHNVNGDRSRSETIIKSDITHNHVDH